MTSQQRPAHQSYDVIIIGGAMMGSSTAWFLTEMAGYDGRVLVVERDPTYGDSSTMHTNSCMRQQFSSALNVRISQFAADFVKNLRSYMGGNPDVPELKIHNFGYLYLANTEERAAGLRASHAVQTGAGAGTELLSPNDIAARYPFYHLNDILLGSLNTRDEGYWDGIAVFDWWRKSARMRGIEFIANEVVGLERAPNRREITGVRLASGEVVGCARVVNASGPRAARTCAMAGIPLPVEPRKRYTWVFTAQTPLDRPLPLTIDPSGVHVRQEGPGSYQAGGHSLEDPAVAYDDFTLDPSLWEEHIWPTLAARIPAFEAIRVTHEWAGHYAYNTLDQNAIIGPHPEVENFFFINGFSGHGLQQSPAMGRGLAELLAHGEYRSLDLSPFSYTRIQENRPFVEEAVI